MGETTELLEIVKHFTLSINEMNKTFGSLHTALFEISKKLDFLPKNDLLTQKLDDIKASTIKQFLDALGEAELSEKFDFIMDKLETEFKTLRMDLSKYEEFLKLLKSKTEKEILSISQKENQEYKLQSDLLLKEKDKEIKQLEVNVKEKEIKTNFRLQIWLKILAGVGTGIVIALSIMKLIPSSIK